MSKEKDTELIKQLHSDYELVQKEISKKLLDRTML